MTLIAFGDLMLHASLPNLASRRHCGPTAGQGMSLPLQPCGFSTTIAHLLVPCTCVTPPPEWGATLSVPYEYVL